MFSQQRNEMIRQRLRQLEQMYEERRQVQVVKPAPVVRKSGLWKPIVDYEDPTAVKIGDRVLVKEKYHGEWKMSNFTKSNSCKTQNYPALEICNEINTTNHQMEID